MKDFAVAGKVPLRHQRADFAVLIRGTGLNFWLQGERTEQKADLGQLLRRAEHVAGMAADLAPGETANDQQRARGRDQPDRRGGGGQQR